MASQQSETRASATSTSHPVTIPKVPCRVHEIWEMNDVAKKLGVTIPEPVWQKIWSSAVVAADNSHKVPRYTGRLEVTMCDLRLVLDSDVARLTTNEAWRNLAYRVTSFLQSPDVVAAAFQATNGATLDYVANHAKQLELFELFSDAPTFDQECEVVSIMARCFGLRMGSIAECVTRPTHGEKGYPSWNGPSYALSEVEVIHVDHFASLTVFLCFQRRPNPKKLKEHARIMGGWIAYHLDGISGELVMQFWEELRLASNKLCAERENERESSGNDPLLKDSTPTVKNSKTLASIESSNAEAHSLAGTLQEGPLLSSAERTFLELADLIQLLNRQDRIDSCAAILQHAWPGRIFQLKDRVPSTLKPSLPCRALKT
ncbi:hypothetical protein DL98DRAFT_578886 [Cadophora sp. DSE1049]|nr:hypothetical protein DL98DRAFT_578886 [Cadophora sp. DSE1049]